MSEFIMQWALIGIGIAAGSKLIDFIFDRIQARRDIRRRVDAR